MHGTPIYCSALIPLSKLSTKISLGLPPSPLTINNVKTNLTFVLKLLDRF